MYPGVFTSLLVGRGGRGGGRNQKLALLAQDKGGAGNKVSGGGATRAPAKVGGAFGAEATTLAFRWVWFRLLSHN